jgi:sugar phosphate isomerase/epimerase
MEYNPEVVMHLPFGPKNDLCNLLEYEKVVKTMKDAITYSRMFNVHKFTLHLGYANGNRGEVINHLVKVLQDLCDYAYPSNIMIENMPGIKEVGYSPIEIKDIIGRVSKSNLKFIFDTGHANVSGFSFYEYFELLKTDLTHIHINDNDGSRDQHARIGAGNIDFKSFLKELTDYQELFCLEILYKDVNDLLEYSRDLDKCI